MEEKNKIRKAINTTGTVMTMDNKVTVAQRRAWQSKGLQHPKS